LRIIVLGAGDIGMSVIHYLSQKGNILAVIEKDEKKCKHISDHADAAIFNGSVTDLEIWSKIEADKADALYVLTNDDKANIEACEIAKKQFGIPFVIARAHQPENIEKIRETGADVVICPSLETRRLFLNPLESRYLETLYEKDDALFKVVVVVVPPDGSVIGKTVESLDFSERCRITTIFRNGSFVFPSDSFVLKGGDRVIISGEIEDVEKAVEKLANVEVT
jgi:trk/ktr system potassium uptake protein